MKKMVLGIVVVAITTWGGCASSPARPELTPEQQAAQVAWEMTNPQYTSAGNFRWVKLDDGIRLSRYTGTATDVRIPPQMYGWPVIAIGAGAFRGERLHADRTTLVPLDVRLTSVMIPDSVRRIGDRAFAGNQLTSVTIPDSVTYLGWGAFARNRLTNVTIGNRVTSIRGAFEDNLLTSVDIPDSVRTIGERAFSNNRLVSATIPSGATVHQEAFSRNGRLRRNVVTPQQRQQLAEQQQQLAEQQIERQRQLAEQQIEQQRRLAEQQTERLAEQSRLTALYQQAGRSFGNLNGTSWRWETRSRSFADMEFRDGSFVINEHIFDFGFGTSYTERGTFRVSGNTVIFSIFYRGERLFASGTIERYTLRKVPFEGGSVKIWYRTF